MGFSRLIFGEGGPAGGPPPGDMDRLQADHLQMGEWDHLHDMGDHMGPPPGDMPPPDGMGDMHTHMDDAGSHQGPEGPGPDGPPMPGDMPPGDMPPPPDDDPNAGGEVCKSG